MFICEAAHTYVSQGKCTQASASQDILTMMKEWRIEASETSDRSSEDAPSAEEAPADSQQQTVGNFFMSPKFRDVERARSSLQ